MGRGSTQEPQSQFIYFFTAATICISADSILDSLDYFADYVADVFGLFRQNHVADVFLMTIMDMEIIQENFYYSQDASLISLFLI